MNVENSEKNYCFYCKQILSKTEEIELNYHISCKKAMEKFEKEDKGKIIFLSKSLSLSESLVLKFLQVVI